MSNNYAKILEERILGFFNTVTNADEIVNRIKDDPNFSAVSPTDFGISQSAARQILEKRSKLSDKHFTSIRQIDEVKGVGLTTLHNILYSFWATISGSESIGQVSVSAETYGFVWKTGILLPGKNITFNLNSLAVRNGNVGILTAFI